MQQWHPGIEIGVGVYTGMPDEVYRAQSDWLSQSSLKMFAEAPALYRHGEARGTRPQALGTICHAAILEPQSFEARYCRTTLAKTARNAWAAQAEAVHPRELTKADEYDAALGMAFSIQLQQGPLADLMGWDGVTREVSFFWIDPIYGLKCKGRADGAALTHGMVFDLKTVASISQWPRSVRNYAYHWQEFYYRMGLCVLGYNIKDFWFFVIETKAPHLYVSRTIPLRWKRAAEEKVMAAMRDFKEAQAANRWPGYSTDFEETQLPEAWLTYD